MQSLRPFTLFKCIHVWIRVTWTFLRLSSSVRLSACLASLAPVAVVLAFFICWAPFHAQRLMATHVTESPTPIEEVTFAILTHISGITYYVSATINPILYSIMSLKFRQAFKDTLGRCCGRRPSGGHFDERTVYQPKSQV